MYDISYYIKAATNGWIVRKSWQELTTTKDTTWRDEATIFGTWDEVVKYVEDNQLPFSKAA